MCLAPQEAAEVELARQAEVAYRRLVTGLAAVSEVGRERDTGTRIFKAV